MSDGRSVAAGDWPLRSVTRNESLAQSVLETTVRGAHRFTNDKIVDGWRMVDWLDILDQLESVRARI
jgi:hypothetical protein